MNTEPITRNGFIIKADQITIDINRTTSGDPIDAYLQFTNKIYVPGTAKAPYSVSYLTSSDIDPQDYYNLAMLLEKLFLSDKNRQQIETVNLD